MRFYESPLLLALDCLRRAIDIASSEIINHY